MCHLNNRSLWLTEQALLTSHSGSYSIVIQNFIYLAISSTTKSLRVLIIIIFIIGAW